MRINIANTFIKKLLWLYFKKDNEILLIQKCNSIHTFFFNRPINLIWLDSKDKIVKIEYNVFPNSIKACKEANSVIEYFTINQKYFEKYQIWDEIKI